MRIRQAFLNSSIVVFGWVLGLMVILPVGFLDQLYAGPEEEWEILETALTEGIVLYAKKIPIKVKGRVFNPSILDLGNDEFLLSFRYQVDAGRYPSLSNIGLTLLGKNLAPRGPIQWLNTRVHATTPIPSQSEDARLFMFRGEPWIIYNDNVDEMDPDNPNSGKRRDMFIARIQSDEGRFLIDRPLKLYHSEKWSKVFWQKNWVPFEYEGRLLMSYFLDPHEVLEVDLDTGCAAPVFISQPALRWKYGQMRGGTPAELVDGEYLSFFHSACDMDTPFTGGKAYHYFMGACTYNPEPPFQITKLTQLPLMNAQMYAPVPGRQKPVVFPGGFVVKGNKIYVAFGKDDLEVWIAVVDKNRLIESLQSVP